MNNNKNSNIFELNWTQKHYFPFSICIALDCLQKDIENIADATHEWLTLSQSNELKPCMEAVMNSLKKKSNPITGLPFLKN